MLIQPMAVWEAGNCSKYINLNLYYEIGIEEMQTFRLLRISMREKHEELGMN